MYIGKRCRWIGSCSIRRCGLTPLLSEPGKKQSLLSNALENKLLKAIISFDFNDMKKALLSFWTLEGGELTVGNAELLDQPLTAFFASRQCSGTAVRAVMAWAIDQASNKSPIISGFHSPLEQSVLEVMLSAGAPWVMVRARKFEINRLQPAWLQAVQESKSAIVSIADTTRRLTSELAEQRNEWVCAHADMIVIGHASPGGRLLAQARQWGADGRQISYLS